MLGRRLHLGLDATSVPDILSFISRPKGNLEKEITMILLDIGKEQVCLMYRSTRVYDYNTTIDWLILIARLLSTITFRDKSSADVVGRRERCSKNTLVEWTKQEKKEIHQKSRINN
jgi:hypothetical protein